MQRIRIEERPVDVEQDRVKPTRWSRRHHDASRKEAEGGTGHRSSERTIKYRPHTQDFAHHRVPNLITVESHSVGFFFNLRSG